MDYSKVYYAIIEKAKRENRRKDGVVYYESHHILPRCLGGTGKYSQWRSHPNLVLLTAKEHFLCHRLLCKMYPGNASIAAAYWGMCNQKNNKQTSRVNPSARAYAEGRELFKKTRSEALKGKPATIEQAARLRAYANARKGKPAPHRGKPKGPRSEEVKKKISETMKGISRPLSKEHYESMLRVSAKRRGVATHNALRVLHVESGVVYQSVERAAQAVGRSSRYIRNRIDTGEYKYL